MEKFELFRYSKLFGIRTKWLIAMKTFILLFFAFSIQLNASVLSQQRVSMKMSNVSAKELIKEIESQTDLGFIYNLTEIEKLDGLFIDADQQTVEEVLDEVLEGTDLTYEIDKSVIIIIPKPEEPKVKVQQEKRELKGTVTDEDGNSLPGVSVVVKSTTTGVSTNIDGEYTINVDGDNVVLVYSFVGMITQEIVFAGQLTINIELKADTENLDEVIVTGYQKMSVERSTGSVVTVKAADVEKKGHSNLLNSLEGMVAGFGINADPNNEGSKKINIRGVATINGNSAPLVVIDGFPVDTDLSQINPYDVESVTVLKDAGSASIYGARAANGVVVVTTKKGKKGKVKVNYSNNFTINERPDVAYRLNRASSNDLVDAQISAANGKPLQRSYRYRQDSGTSYLQHYVKATNVVYNTLALQNDGYIDQSQVDAIINPLRSIDNMSQIRDLFTQKPTEQQHNLSLSGGSDKNQYRATVNYTKNKSSYVGDKSERVIFDFQNSTELNKRVKLELNGNFMYNDRSSIPFNVDNIYNKVNSYQLFKDENGNALPVTLGKYGDGGTDNGGRYGGKDPLEIQRLVDMGLYDESYYPLRELDNYERSNKSISVRLQALLYVDLLKDLKGTFGAKYESSSYKEDDLARENSFEVMNLVNNYSPSDYSGDDADLLIPRGDRLSNQRGDSHSYTLRAQLDYEKSIKKHTFRALAGTEVKHVFKSYNSSTLFGYNEDALSSGYINLKDIYTSNFDGDLNMPGGNPSAEDFNPKVYEKTDRYYSMYGNFSYDFDQKYVFSGSMRIDQSNIYATDPEYRYKPFWSLGAKWNVNEEDFFESDFISRLALRGSYGVNGNIAHEYGPFNIATLGNSFRAGFVDGATITTPSVFDLRWERTATSNIGLDVTMYKRKIRLGVDYYLKNTTDILALGANDPSTGFNKVMKNDANIRNNGLEISLNTTNVQSKNFRWTSSFLLRYNSNEVREIFNDETDVGYIVDGVENRKGYAANGFFVYNWAGLNEDGNATIYNKKGEVIVVDELFDSGLQLTPEDLVFAGSLNPKITGSFSNNFSYKNFDLSFMFVFNYGGVMRKDSYNGTFLPLTPYSLHADAGKAWKESGDEKTTDIPMINHPNASTVAVSKYSTKNILDSDFIRLREVILSYRLPENTLRFLSLENVSLNFRANNLLLIEKNDEGIDPESQGIGERYFPVNPSYSFGVNIGF